MEIERTDDDDLVAARFNPRWIMNFAQTMLNDENINKNAKPVIKRDDLKLWCSTPEQEKNSS